MLKIVLIKKVHTTQRRGECAIDAALEAIAVQQIR